jgi:hypothetical protein
MPQSSVFTMPHSSEQMSDEPKTLAAGNQGQVEESPASTKKDVSQINLGSIQRRMAVAKDRKGIHSELQVCGERQNQPQVCGERQNQPRAQLQKQMHSDV